MNVETYEIEDASSDASAMANDAAAAELIEKLGLVGQQAIMNKETLTRVPYRAMEAQEKAVWETLCDAHEKLEHYQAEPIPVRVLQAAAYAKETEMFQRLEVWYPQVAKIDDPILVGIRVEKDKRPGYDWNTITSFYLIARWGKSLLPFEKLREQAVAMLKTRRRAQLAKGISELQTALGSLDQTEDVGMLAADVSVRC